MIEAVLLLPLVVLLVRFLRVRTPYRITHVDGFNIGFLFYVSFPLLLSISPQLRTLPLVEQWQTIVVGLAGEHLSWLIGFAASSWLVFHAGIALGLLAMSTPPTALREVQEHPRVINYTMLGLGALLVAYSLAHIYSYRELLFAGYSDPVYSQAARGPLQFSMLLIFYLLTFGIERRECVSRRVLWSLGIGALFIVAASLSMGTRQGFVTVAFATAVFLSTLYGGIRRGVFILTAVALLLLLAFIGAWRLGTGGGLLVTAAFEPVGTFISALTVVSFNEMPALAIPDEIAVGLLNLIPSVVWPGKAEYLAQRVPDLKFLAPLGAQHFFVSMITAFGWVGSLVVLFFSAAGLQWFSTRCVSFRRAGSYSILAAVFAMDLWRNPLTITIVKICLQAAFLWPIFVHLTSRAIGWLLEPDLRTAALEKASHRSLTSNSA